MLRPEPNLLTTLKKLIRRVWKRDTPARPGETEGWVERYNFFIETSEHGADCAYARKCMDLFLLDDYEDTKKLVLELLSEFRKVEGEGFGR